jgi:ring-1,2-phenylacetyl-CoA epoxidase subunit PaaE
MNTAQPGDDRHFHALRVASVQPEGDDALVLGFDLPPALAPLYRFQPGQYLTLRRPLAAGAGPADDLRRAYSICAGPGEPLRVGIRQLPGGAFSGWVRREIAVGSVLDVMPPQGRFGALLAEAPQPARHVLALAAGSGITPILAIVKAVLADAQGGRVTLVYVNRSPASSMFLGELQDLKDRHLGRLAVHVAYTREVTDGLLPAGRLDSERLAQVLRLAGGAAGVGAAFVCGPSAFNDEMEAGLRAAGVAAQRIQVERFGAPGVHSESGDAAPAPAPAVQAQTTAARITVLRDGRSHRFDFLPGDDNLLVAAGRAGLDLPFSCRSGVCATCRARVLEGEVSMARNFALADDELAAGFVLACQARPLGPTLQLSFDER